MEGTSLEDLGEVLTEISGGIADINVKLLTFNFGFAKPFGEYLGGAPWDILAIEDLNDLLSNRSTRISCSIKTSDMSTMQQRLIQKRLKAIRLATGVVWRQTMLREFDNALEAGQITLFARPSSGEPFD